MRRHVCSPAAPRRPAVADRAVLRRVLALPARARAGLRPSPRRRSTTRARSSGLERALHVFVEPRVQQLGDAHAAGSTTSRAGCTSTRTSSSRRCTLAFIYLLRNEHFYFVRNMFMVAMGIALVGYVALPDRAAADAARARASPTRCRTSPASRPRLGVNALFNPYAAVPVDARRLRADARRADDPDGAPPLGQGAVGALPADRHAVVVVATANHWWLRRASPAPPSRPSPRLAAQALFARARPAGVGVGRPSRRPRCAVVFAAG